MGLPWTLIAAYIFGGVTLLPILLAASLVYIYYRHTSFRPAIDRGRDFLTGKDKVDDGFDATSVTKDAGSPNRAPRGWIIARRTFNSAAAATAVANATEVASNGAAPNAASSSSVAADIPAAKGTYMESINSFTRSFMESRKLDPKRAKYKDRYYAVLKDTALYLYSDEHEAEICAAIPLTLCDVVIYPEGLIEGELFMKRNAICLRPRDPLYLSNGSNPLHRQNAGTGADTSEHGQNQNWYIWTTYTHQKEDWYHHLLNASRLEHPEDLAKDRLLFDPTDMTRLVDAIDQQPDPIPTRWLNAMIGRLFFSVYRTSAVENYIIRKLVRKLNKVNKPSFLSDIVVKEANVGVTTPFFSKPLLRELKSDGSASMEMHVKYVGEFRITIGTVATLNLGTRFKSYSVSLVLAVVLKELEGTMVFKINPPPSNRLWFSFTHAPRMVISVEPVVSTRQIKWSMVTKPMESRLRELVAESIVMPNMDDIAFFDTKPYLHRAGIFGDCLREVRDPLSEETRPPTDDLDADEETPRIPPGVPNPKLSDEKDTGNLHQHTPSARRTSDASLKSTQSAPPEGSAEKESDPIRKRAWFGTTSSSSPTKTKVHAADSEPNLPSLINKDLRPRKSRTDLKADEPSRSYRLASSSTRYTDTLSTVSGDASDTAADRLRGILENGRARASSSSEESIGVRKVPDTHPATFPAALNPENAAGVNVPGADSSVSAPTTKTQITGTDTLNDVIIADAQFIERTTSPTPSIAPSVASRTSEKSVASSLRSIAPSTTSQTASSSASSSATTTHTTSQLLNAWKAKASDKQAIQASVNQGMTQAKDAMNKWSNRWQAYKSAKLTQPDGSAEAVQETLSHSSFGNLNGTPELGGMSSMARKANEHGSPRPERAGSLDGNAKSESQTSTSPSNFSHFQPSIALPTTSISTAEAVTLPSSPSPANPTAIRRVPPPSAVPVHPAHSIHNRRQSGTADMTGYRPAAMMAIPGMDESRRFAASSSGSYNGGGTSPGSSAAKELRASTPPALPMRPEAVSSSLLASTVRLQQQENIIGDSPNPAVASVVVTQADVPPPATDLHSHPILAETSINIDKEKVASSEIAASTHTMPPALPARPVETQQAAAGPLAGTGEVAVIAVEKLHDDESAKL